MALGDIQELRANNGFGSPGAVTFAVAASSTLIYAGEPVLKALGNTSGKVVSPMATNEPTVGTDYLAGIATTTSTNTASAAGTVDVQALSSNTIYLISPKAPTSFDTQAEYDALVGARVLIDLTTGSYTILASDSANNGCVIEPLDIGAYPGKVAFSFRAALSYKA